MTVLVFGMTVVGCDDGNDDTSYFDTLNLSTAAPTDAALSAGGLTQTQFDQIRDAAGGGFQGWAIEDGGLTMAWTGRSLSNFNSVADVLHELLTENDRENASGVHSAWGNSYDLMFSPERISDGGFYLPAGSMMAHFFQ